MSNWFIMALSLVTLVGCVSSPTLISQSVSPKGGVVSFGRYLQTHRQIKMNDKVRATVREYCRADYDVIEQSSEAVASLNGAQVTPSSGDDVVMSFKCKEPAPLANIEIKEINR